ncbi:hypothetical protein DES33_10279 [Finegoldia magna]|nr:hypothetical protein DES33_10279 [Finegoldia magna]
MVNDFREKGIEGLKLKKRGKPPKMLKSTKISKDIKRYQKRFIIKLN